MVNHAAAELMGADLLTPDNILEFGKASMNGYSFPIPF